MNARIFILPLTIILSACFCGPAAELVPVYVEKPPIEIIAGYSLGRPALGGLELYGKAHECRDNPDDKCYPVVVEQSVVKIGWNDDFILVERHPLDTYILATPDATSPEWFIIILSSSSVHKTGLYEQFNDLKASLNIPDIEMQNAMDIYKR